MKKIILISLFVLTSLCVSAQITNPLPGLQLGISTKADVINYLDEKGCPYSSWSDIIVNVNQEIEYEGVKWDSYEFRFEDDYLMSIEFESVRPGVGNSLWDSFNKINGWLQDRYPKYFKEFSLKNDSNLSFYNDGVTEIFLTWFKAGSDNYLKLSYTDNELYKKCLYY